VAGILVPRDYPMFPLFGLLFHKGCKAFLLPSHADKEKRSWEIQVEQPGRES